MNSNPLCDLTPIFRDYESHLAGIEQQLGGGGGGPESAASRAPGAAPPPPRFGAATSQQESAFLFHGHKTEDASEKKTEADSEKKVDPSVGAASASFSFSKKIDGSVLGSLNSGPLTGFSFSSGNSSFFGKDMSQKKPASALSSETPEEPAGGSDERKGNDAAGPSSKPAPGESSRCAVARAWVCVSGRPGLTL